MGSREERRIHSTTSEIQDTIYKIEFFFPGEYMVEGWSAGSVIAIFNLRPQRHEDTFSVWERCRGVTKSLS